MVECLQSDWRRSSIRLEVVYRGERKTSLGRDARESFRVHERIDSLCQDGDWKMECGRETEYAVLKGM